MTLDKNKKCHCMRTQFNECLLKCISNWGANADKLRGDN